MLFNNTEPWLRVLQALRVGSTCSTYVSTHTVPGGWFASCFYQAGDRCPVGGASCTSCRLCCADRARAHTLFLQRVQPAQKWRMCSEKLKLFPESGSETPAVLFLLLRRQTDEVTAAAYTAWVPHTHTHYYSLWSKQLPLCFKHFKTGALKSRISKRNTNKLYLLDLRRKQNQ